MECILIIAAEIFLFHFVIAYQDRCPQFVERQLCINYLPTCALCSKNNPFHCLLKDDTQILYKDCKSWDWVSKGFHPVLRGKYIDYEKCKSNRYQPFDFLSNEHYQCYLAKSNCIEEGQIEYKSGDEMTDRTCQCDYTKGYAFYTVPRNKLFCIPSEEQCTCFRKTCPTSQAINEEYECVDMLGHKNNTMYSENITTATQREDFNEMPVSGDSKHKTHGYNTILPRINFKLRIILTLLIVTSVMFSLCVIILVADRGFEMLTVIRNEEVVENKEKVVENKEDVEVNKEKIVENNEEVMENKEDVVENKEENKGEIKKNKDDIPPEKHSVLKQTVSTDTNYDISLLADNIASLKISVSESPKLTQSSDINRGEQNRSLSETPYIPQDANTDPDEYSNSEKFLKVMKPTDIVILHVEDTKQKTDNLDDTQSAESLQVFKDHLETFADDWGFNYRKINFFEDVFVWCDHNNKIKLPDVLNKCRIVFIYLSEHFLPGKLRRYGLSESSVIFILKTLNDFPKVKTVCVCERSKLYEENIDIHIDFHKYNKSKDIDIYESNLRDIFEQS